MDASRKQRWPMQKDGGKSRWNEVHTRAQHQEVSEEEAALDTVKTLGGRLEDRRQTLTYRYPRKTRTRHEFAGRTPEGPMVVK